MANLETTVSPAPLLLVQEGLNLINASRGVYFDSSASISGPVGNLDFSGAPIKRFTVTGDLSGSFNMPPIGVPTLGANSQSVVLTVLFIQDATGGHVIDLDTLFSGIPEALKLGNTDVDDGPGAVTVVDLVMRRNEGGVISYTANFAPSFDAAQIETGVFLPDRLPYATGSAAGAVILAAGSSGAARGNHRHLQPFCKTITIVMSGGGAIPNGDYTLEDVPTSGTVLRLTGLRWSGGTSPTGTVTAKIATTLVTGTGTAVNQTPSTDANATAANTFVARQVLSVNVSAVAGSPTMLSGFLHYTLLGDAWVE
jgi:hypothetical protein